MAFRDYSTTPSANTLLSDGTYIGPDMDRDKVRPAIQQIAADGRGLSDRVEALVDGTADPTLRIDLTDTTGVKGAALIGNSGGGTVQDAVFVKGRTTAIAGSKMAIRWLRDDATYPLEDEAGIWAGQVATDHGISANFALGQGSSNAPSTALFVMSNASGSQSDVCAAIFDSVARSDNAVVFGANVIARGTGKTGCKFVGLEVDVEPSSGDASISSSSMGLAVNMFVKALPGPAIMTGGVGGGTFNNGVILGGLAPGAAGLALQSSGQANSLVNTTVGSFNGVALTLGNGKSRSIQLGGTGTTHAYIYNDGANNIRHVMGAGAWIVRDAADVTSLFVVDNSGNADLQAGGALRVSGTKVVGARGAAVAAPTGGATVDTEARTAITAVISRLQTHGLIA